MLELFAVDLPNSAIGIRYNLKLGTVVKQGEFLTVKVSLVKSSNFYFIYIVEVLLDAAHACANYYHKIVARIVLFYQFVFWLVEFHVDDFQDLLDIVELLFLKQAKFNWPVNKKPIYI